MEMLDPNNIVPLHDAHDADKLTKLIDSMTTNGWSGAPIVVIPGRDYGWGPGNPQAITGSHRIAAARETGIDIPTIDLNQLLDAHGIALADLDDEYGVDPDDETHYEAIRRLDEHLPANVVDHYGLDAH